MWYLVIVLDIRYNMFVGNETLSLSVYEAIAIQILLGGTVPNLGEGVGLEGGVWYPITAHRNGHNLSLETVAYSRFV